MMYSPFELQCHNLALIRDDRLLFKQLSFSVSNQSVIHVKGANGAGKTSLLRVICGLLEADEGELTWNGQPLSATRYEFYSQLTYLGHLSGLKGQLTVAENLTIFAQLRGISDRSEVVKAIKLVGLSGYDDQWVSNLSQGQTKRVGLARLIIEKSSLWILDEPFVALDILGQKWLHALINQHVNDGGSLILTSHQPLSLDAPVEELIIGKQAAHV